MGKGQHLGEFEQVVMLAVARPSAEGHGAGIHKEILDTAGRDVSISSVYVTLNRLESKGCEMVALSGAATAALAPLLQAIDSGGDALHARAAAEAAPETPKPAAESPEPSYDGEY